MQGSAVDSTGGHWAWPLFGFAPLRANVLSVFGDIHCPASGKEEGAGCRCHRVTPHGPPSSEGLGGLSEITQPNQTTG